MPDTALRLIDTLRHIPRHPLSISTPRLTQLLEQLGYEVTPRMVQRDLEKLSRYGISCDEGKPKLWYWTPGAKVIDIPGLDPQAALTFALAERHLRMLMPASTLAYLDPYFATAKWVLDAHGKGLSRWPDKIRVLPRGQRLVAPTIDPAIQDTVYQALLEERRVDLSYLPSGSRQRKAYQASLLALVVRDQVIYLVCTLWDYEDVIQLDLHRVKSATLLEQPIHKPAAFDIDEYIRRGEFGFRQGDAIRLVVLFERGAGLPLAETPLSKDQKIKETPDQRLRVEATVADTEELRWWLLAFGGEVEVLRPVKVRRDIAARLTDAADRDRPPKH